MNYRNNIKYVFSLLMTVVLAGSVYAGNPDRQGEAGAGELLFNPWARSAGLHSMTTSSVMGVEAMRLNIAGLSRIDKTEILIGNTRLYEGTDIKLNALGFAQKLGENSAFGISLTSVDFGDIPITTTTQPEGTGGTFSPGYFHFGLGYSYTYENKISVGVLFRGISEGVSNLSAFGFAIDAGVQYVTGEDDNFKLGISLRNIGTPMSFGGEGLAFETDNPGNTAEYQITLDTRAQEFELPSMLNIGISYDFIFTEDVKLRTTGNFTSNSFARDQIGAGAEVFYKNIVGVRAGYKIDMGSTPTNERNLYSGLAAGISLNLPVKNIGNKSIGVDYAYRATDPFQGTHNFSLRLAL